MCVILIVRVLYLFYHNIICVNCDVCECMHVYYKCNITLYNLRIKKYGVFVTCVYIVKKVNDVSSI